MYDEKYLINQWSVIYVQVSTFFII